MTDLFSRDLVGKTKADNPSAPIKHTVLHLQDLPSSVDRDGYRQYAEPTRHQRGQECTGFALASAADYLLRKGSKDAKLPAVSPRMMYEMAQVYDRAAYSEGSTLLGALLGWQRQGVTTEAGWPYEADDEQGEVHGSLTLARINDARTRMPAGRECVAPHDLHTMKSMLSQGAVLYAGATIHDGWYRLMVPDKVLIDRRDDDLEHGGHAFLIVGYDDDKKAFWLHNSWGPHWGDDGYGLLPYDDWTEHGQDLWALGEAESRPSVTDTEPEKIDTEEFEKLRSQMWPHVVALTDEGHIRTDAPFAATENTLGTLLWLFEQHAVEHGWQNPRLLLFADDGSLALPNAVKRLQGFRDALIDEEIYPIFLVWDVPWLYDLEAELRPRPGNLDLRWLVVPPTAETRTPVETSIGHVDPTYLMYEYLVPQTMAVHMWRAVQARGHRASSLSTGGARILAEQIGDYMRNYSFEVHVAAHGAGDFLLSELVARLPDIASCELWAPATTVQSFNAHYLSLLDGGRVGRLSVTTLDHESEMADSIGDYHESILSLASNVLSVAGVDSDERFHWGPRSDVGSDVWNFLNLKVSAAAEWDRWRSILRLDAEPIVGMHRFVGSSSEIDRLTKSGLVEVHTEPGVMHAGLVEHPALWAAAISRIKRSPTKPSTAKLADPPLSETAQQMMDPLVRARAIYDASRQAIPRPRIGGPRFRRRPTRTRRR